MKSSLEFVEHDNPSVDEHNGLPHVVVMSIVWKGLLFLRAVRTAGNGGEVYIPGVGKVDGFHSRSNTVFEFHGDYYHGNPEVFRPNSKPHPFDRRITAKRLFRKTTEKERKIRALGYHLITMWESEWKRQIKAR